MILSDSGMIIYLKNLQTALVHMFVDLIIQFDLKSGWQEGEDEEEAELTLI